MKKILLLLGLVLLVSVGCTKSPVAMEGENGAEMSGIDIDAEVNELELDNSDSLDENVVSGSKLKDFLTKDVYGNEIDERIFTDKKLTVLNLWGTFCGPCIEEMPDLEKISNEYKDKNVAVVGIVIDDPSPEDAQKMLEELGVTYINIFPDDKLKELITDKFDYVPVTLFIDSNGEVLKTFIPGSEDKETFKRIIDKLIEDN